MGPILGVSICICICLYTYSHPGVDRIWFRRGFYFLKNTVIFDPIDRIWIFCGFQPSVHSEICIYTPSHNYDSK